MFWWLRGVESKNNKRVCFTLALAMALYMFNGDVVRFGDSLGSQLFDSFFIGTEC